MYIFIKQIFVKNIYISELNMKENEKLLIGRANQVYKICLDLLCDVWNIN